MPELYVNSSAHYEVACKILANCYNPDIEGPDSRSMKYLAARLIKAEIVSKAIENLQSAKFRGGQDVPSSKDDMFRLKKPAASSGKTKQSKKSATASDDQVGSIGGGVIAISSEL